MLRESVNGSNVKLDYWRFLFNVVFVFCKVGIRICNFCNRVIQHSVWYYFFLNFFRFAILDNLLERSLFRWLVIHHFIAFSDDFITF